MDQASELQNLPEHEIYDIRDLKERKGGAEEAQDDYALRRVPATWRWSAWASLWAYSGIATAMALPLTGGILAVMYGGRAAIVAAILTYIYTAIGVYYLSLKAANEGAVAELISKHTFGFVGSAYQILIYALLLIVYFSLEGHVMSAALSEVITFLPYWFNAALICFAFIPLSLYGMQFLSKFQLVTAWLYGCGVILIFAALLLGWSAEISSARAGHAWWNVNPKNVPFTWQSVLSAFGTMAGTVGSVLIIICSSTARLARRTEARKTALLMSLVGVTFPLLVAMICGVYLVAATGGTIADPGVSLPRLLGATGLVFILLTQVRVNVLNVYFGTTALENFSSQIFRTKWTRTAFLLPFMTISYILLVSPLLKYFGLIMTMLSVVLVSWISVIFGELWLVRGRFGIPQWAEFRRGYAPSYNKIGMASMWVPGLGGVLMASGLFGPDIYALAVPVAGIVAFFMPIGVSSLMSRSAVIAQYFSRVPARVGALQEICECALCKKTFHRSDFVMCPFHRGAFICSGCCATERQCDTMCHAPQIGGLSIQANPRST
jgi:cytosine permease